MNKLEFGSSEWWEDVEQKISLICYKFDNLSSWHEDLAQELRLHAYYVSSDYYNLYRKAIDFWRTIQAKYNPESPYYDLETVGGLYTDTDPLDQTSEIVNLIKEELNHYPQNKWEEKKISLTLDILDLILDDIDPKKSVKSTDSSSTHYINSKVNITWVSDVLHANYKQCKSSLQILAEIIRGLAMMRKIDIPEEYLKDFYE